MNWGLFCLMLAGVMGRIQGFPSIIPIGIVSLWCGVLLVRSLGKDMPILEITATVYCLQLLVCPWLSYLDPPMAMRYQMSIPPEEYFSFVIPAVCAFLIPLCYVRDRLPALHHVMNLEAGDRVFSVGVWICLLGIILNAAYPYAPLSIRFAIYLGGDLRYIGALYCYFSRHRHRRMILTIVGALTIASSMANAMFHQLLIWGAILLSLVIARDIRQPSVTLRVMMLICGFCAMVVLESYKTHYREVLRNQNERSVLGAIYEVMSTDSLDEDGIRDVVRIRLNQGWIVANVLRHIPKSQPYLGGETFYSAFQDAFIPRAMIQKQVTAGGRDNFRKMTGLKIGDNTSMGVSPIGEAYGNFGLDSGIVAMFCFGVFYAGSYFLLFRWSQKHVLFGLWLPLVFSQAVKCETELAVVLNHLVKAAVFSLVMYPLLHRLLFGKQRVAIERDLALMDNSIVPRRETLVRSP